MRAGEMDISAGDGEAPTLATSQLADRIQNTQDDSELLPLLAEMTRDLVSQKLANQPALDWLLCAAYLKEGSAVADPSSHIDNLHTPQSVCPYCFKDGDLVWNCKTCQADETCVLCNQCYQDSNHEGHEVYFFYSNTEGCCDCGDPSAWAAEGFCSSHGPKQNHDPVDDLPPQLVKCARVVLQALVECISEHIECEQGAGAAEPAEDEDEVYSVQVSSISKARQDEDMQLITTTLLNDLSWSGPAAAAVAQQIKKDSRGTIGIGVTHAEAVRWLSVFRNLPELFISCYTSSQWWMRREGLAGIVAWLLRAVRAADGLAQLVVQAIVQCGIKPSLLSLLVANQAILPKAAVEVINKLLLQLLVDSGFKRQFGQVYAITYEHLAAENRVALFNFSVQFLNRESYVRYLVLEHGLLDSIIVSLVTMLEPQRPEAPVLPPTLHDQHYIPVIKDLRYCFSHLNFSFEIICEPQLAQGLRNLVHVLANVQNMHQQQRVEAAHVEWETTEWMHSFNLSLTLASSFEKVVVGVVSSIMATVSSGAQVASSMSCMLDVFYHPAIELLKDTSMIDDPKWDCKVLAPFSVRSQPNSFHNPVHRFIAGVMCSLFTLQCEEVQLLSQRLLAELPQSTGLQLMEAPLRTLVFAAQIRVGLWVRNGSIMRDQLLNYMRWPLCLHFVDKDILAIQLAVGSAAVSPATFLSTLVSRFELDSWIDGTQAVDGAPQSVALAVEMVRVLIHVVTELPMDPTDLKLKLSREVVHFLAWKDATHSELTLLCEDNCLHNDEAALDSVLSEVAFRKTNDSSPDLFSLKAEYWSSVDPLFIHLLPQAREKAHVRASEQAKQNSKSEAQVKPIVCTPPSPHRAFEGFRASILLHPLCMRIVHQALFQSLGTTREAQPSPVLSDAALQLLTLAAYSCDAGSTAQLRELCASTHNEQPCVMDLLKQLGQNCEPKVKWLLKGLGEEAATNRSPQSAKQQRLLQKKRHAKQQALLKAQKSQAAFAKGLADVTDEDDTEAEEDMCLICQGSDAAGGQLLTRIGFIQPLVSYQTSAHDKAAQRRMSPVQFCNHSVHLSCFEDWSSSDTGGTHSIDQTDGEFLCPLCKAPSNLLCPVLPAVPSTEEADVAYFDHALEMFETKIRGCAFVSGSVPDVRGGVTQAVTITVAETLKLAAVEWNAGKEWDCGLDAMRNLVQLLRSRPNWRKAEWCCGTGSINGAPTACWRVSPEALSQCMTEGTCSWVNPQFDIFEATVGFVLHHSSAAATDLFPIIAAVHQLESLLLNEGASDIVDVSQEEPSAATSHTLTAALQHCLHNSQQLSVALGQPEAEAQLSSKQRTFVKQIYLLGELCGAAQPDSAGLSPEALQAACRLFCCRRSSGHVQSAVLLPRELVSMPASFAEVYSGCIQLVQNRTARPAICLICGTSIAATVVEEPDGAAACAKHVQQCTGEVGIFFLVQECCVLLMRKAKAAYYVTLYVDQFGERLQNNSQRGRPLFLDKKQVEQLRHLWLSNQVAAKVVSVRCSADRVIRENYF